MNLFITSECPRECAVALDDRRLIKAVLETAQLISTTLGVGYKPTHQHHPVTKWVGLTKANLLWAYEHFLELGNEYSFRFGNRVHKCNELIPVFLTKLTFDTDGTKLTPFQNSARNVTLGLDYSHLPVTQAYREYLKHKWVLDGIKARWTNQQKPAWAY